MFHTCRAVVDFPPAGCALTRLALAVERLPNVILIVADNLGYADMGVNDAGFGTPNPAS